MSSDRGHGSHSSSERTYIRYHLKVHGRQADCNRAKHWVLSSSTDALDSSFWAPDNTCLDDLSILLRCAGSGKRNGALSEWHPHKSAKQGTKAFGTLSTGHKRSFHPSQAVDVTPRAMCRSESALEAACPEAEAQRLSSEHYSSSIGHLLPGTWPTELRLREEEGPRLLASAGPGSVSGAPRSAKCCRRMVMSL